MASNEKQDFENIRQAALNVMLAVSRAEERSAGEPGRTGCQPNSGEGGLVYIVKWTDGLGQIPVDMPPSNSTAGELSQRLCCAAGSMGVRVSLEEGVEQTTMMGRMRYVLPIPRSPTEALLPDIMRTHVLPSTAFEHGGVVARYHVLWHRRPASVHNPRADQAVLGQAQAVAAGQGLASFRLSLYTLLHEHTYAEVHLWVSFALGVWRRSHLLLTCPTPRLWELVQSRGAMGTVANPGGLPDGIYL